MAEKAKFIGTEALQEIANKYHKEIVMGAIHFRPDVFDKMKIQISIGLQFKDTRTMMNRKGHTTVRKEVDNPVRNTLGYLEERKMVGHLSMNRYIDNKDNYNELAIVDTTDNVTYTYPLSEMAFNTAVNNYGEDVFDCLFHGDDTIDKDASNKHLRLYTGFITYLRQDITMGRINKAFGNYVSVASIDEPADTTDIEAWKIAKDFRSKLSSSLRNAPEVMWYCDEVRGAAMADGYGNSKGNNRGVIYNEDGTYRFPEWKNITVCPESSFGEGDLMIATTPYNFEYGVDTEDSRSSVSARIGSDTDHTDISFQIQSIQGTRVMNVNASNFCMTNGTLLPVGCAGDYTKDTYFVSVNDATMGSVTVNDAAPDSTIEYASGTALTLKATAKEGFEFVRWSNDSTTAETTVTTKGQPGAMVAMFAKKKTV